MFRGKEKKEKEFLELEVEEPVDCLADFTFNFHWQHKGEKLDPSWKIPDNDYTFKEVVEHLKKGYNVHINGDVGHRLCSSMGVDLQYFGGNGGDIPVGDVFVEGNVDSRMGISMIRGNIYIKGKVNEPIGNLIEVKSDEKGYKKFKSITDILTNGIGQDKLKGAQFVGNKLTINDGTVKDTVGARLNIDTEILFQGNVDLSTGILMRKGIVRINGNAGKNTGALLNGGTVIVNGDTDDFTAIDMIKGTIIVNGDAGKFLAANKKNGIVMARRGKSIPPAEKVELTYHDQKLLLSYGFNPQEFIKFE